DFPTGGVIMGREGIIDAYRTGRGKIVIRGKCHVEETKRHSSVVITEIPYAVNKATMIEGIVKCIQAHTIDGVADLRDESDRQGMRVVLDLTRDGDPELVQRQLFSRTMMQSTFGVINLAILDKRPVEMTLKQMLEVFLDYRRGVVRRRTEFRLAKAEAREHIIEGLCRALDLIDQVIAIIRGAQDVDTARTQLMEELQFSDKQAQAILDMRLQRLTGLEREKLLQEMTQLLADIARYKEILGDAHVLDGVIRGELTELRRRFSDKRRTEIQAHVETCGDSYEDLLPEEDIVVTLSQDGYLRRTPLKDYGVQARGGKGRRGAVLASEDQVSLVDVTSTHSDIMFFTSRGRVFAIRGHVVPETRSGKGKHISKFISLNEGETVVALKGTFSENHRTVLFITRRGITKRMDISELDNLTRAGRQVLSLDDGDEIAKVRTTCGTNDLLFVSASGRGLRVNEDEIRTMGRSARGVKAMKLAEDDVIVSCEVIGGDKQILLVSERGIGKRTSFDEFSVHHRATGGMKAMGISARTGRLAVATSVSLDDEVVLITANGRMVRLFVSDIPLLGRTAAGSYLVRPDEGDIVAGVSVIHKDSADAEASNVPLSKPEEAEGTLPFDLDTDDLEQTPSSPEEEE
ncbi:MAG: DNA gyrase subunit A, partial [Pyramidobacter sp.]|nr:DNA gyrase subunit A [Pyramidobacter sp.]